MRGSTGQPESAPKRHLDLFSHHSTAHGYVQQTDRHTDHGTSVTIGRIVARRARDAWDPGLPWGWNLYPHTHPTPKPMGISIGILIPTADLVGSQHITAYNDNY